MTAAVLFDLDGTLIDGENAWERAHRDTVAAYGKTISPETLRTLVGVDLEVSVAAVMAAIGERVLGPLRADHVREWLLDTVADLYRRGDAAWLPGAREALGLVADAGLPVALVTNTPRRLVEVLAPQLELGRFGAVVCGDDVLRGKPAPDPYLRAGELLGVDPTDCLAVEDSPSGAESAEEAGMRVLVLPGALPVADGPRRVRGTLADVLGLVGV